MHVCVVANMQALELIKIVVSWMINNYCNFSWTMHIIMLLCSSHRSTLSKIGPLEIINESMLVFVLSGIGYTTEYG